MPRSAEEVLLGLDPEQRAVAQSPLGPMVVLAGAGTGKTRAITHHITYGVWNGGLTAPQVLAVDLTARAA
ncbi:MAG: UvrD-helicase domain-containing protein, partial [Ornithinimicrobium sp.]|uniref:UvrD-helicase domain-containing protein n=1 Tax=Ornithinimicrobium sp. TaxID=1977084 RepID=UPI003D9B417F